MERQFLKYIIIYINNIYNFIFFDFECYWCDINNKSIFQINININIACNYICINNI